MPDGLYERGPDGHIHVPAFTRGCYYGRPGECCVVCYFRILWRGIRGENDPLAGADDLIGMRVEVPDPQRTKDQFEFIEATVIDVHLSAEAVPDVVTVRINEGEEFDVPPSDVRYVE